MFITIENRVSKKTGNIYSVAVLHSVRGELFMSFDEKILALLSDGGTYIQGEGVLAKFKLEKE